MIKFLTVALLFINISSFSATIEATNPAYSGKKIDFYTWDDPISLQKTEAFSMQFDKNGLCKANINISKPTFVFSDFGIYRGFIILEPSKNIKLLFPPLREKSFADEKNPFFTPVSFWFDTENPSDVSKRIMQFEVRINELTDRYLENLYFQKSKNYLDTIGNIVRKEFASSGNELFEMHKSLRLNSLKSDVLRLSPQQTANDFADFPLSLATEPGFSEYFNKTFHNRLGFDAHDIRNEGIKAAVNSGNISRIVEHTKANYKIKGTLVDLVVLKMIYDAYYSGEFSKNALTGMLNSAYFSQNQSPEITNFAKSIYEKLIFLQPGTKAETICLSTLDATTACTDTKTGKYKYLFFADTEMLICREHLKFLSKIDERFNKNLDIFIVFRNADKTKLKQIDADYKLPGVKLVDTDGKYFKNYKLRTYPYSLLLDESHQVVFDQTKNPIEGFEQQFGSYLQKALFEKQRTQKK